MNYNKKFYEKHGIKVTDEPIMTNQDKAVSNILERYFHLVHKQQSVSLTMVAELEDYVERYPDVKSFKNYLYAAYMRTNQKQKAAVCLDKTIQQHPDYIFAHMNLANRLMEEKNFNKAADILKQPYDIRDFEKDEYIHVSAFKGYYSTAIRLELERENKDEAERMHRILFDYDPKDKTLKELAILLLSFGFKKQAENKPINNREMDIISKPIKGHYLADEKGNPIFNHLEINQLYQYSLENIPKKVIENILSLPRPTLVQDLEHAFMDTAIRYEYFQEKDWNDNKNNFFIHALFLLTELKSYESLPVILDFLRQDEEFREYWLADWLETRFHPTLYLLASNQLEALTDFALEENISPWNRLLMTEIAAQVAMKQPERRNEVLNWFKGIIQYHLDNPANDNLISTEFLSGLIADLVHIRAVELEDAIKELHATGWIDDRFNGKLVEVLKDLHEPFDPFYINPLPVDIYELYSREYEKRKDKSQMKHDPKLLETLNDPYFNYKTHILTEVLSKAFGEYDDDFEDDDWEPQLPVKRAEPKVGRNDPCPCGSGKKYKKCHGN